jgi:hypothetical protein
VRAHGAVRAGAACGVWAVMGIALPYSSMCVCVCVLLLCLVSCVFAAVCAGVECGVLWRGVRGAGLGEWGWEWQCGNVGSARPF